ncbi:TM2 domain-containing protein [Paludibacter sp. 221]|uniref:TM2 domain-containing protein n=1 Tax=Paludibacter sp. 221 TaxID=2302939 RepID=UPI0013D878E2|nr:TM2 domain-containing protein [Paludibacter sp. 221]
MEKNHVNMWLAMNAENFAAEDLMIVKERLENIPEDKLILLQGANFQKPSTILLIAIFLGWERFWLDDVTLGIVKIITCYGCMIWWLVDIFSARKRAQKYNFQKFIQMVSFM